MPEEPPVREVLMVPDYTESNPYQAGLISGLEREGVEVSTADVAGLAPLLSAVINQGRPDLVHIHWLHRFIETDRFGRRLIAFALACRTVFELVVLRAVGIPVVWTVHNVQSHERRDPYLELAFRHVAARLVRRMIVHCPAARSTILARYRLPDQYARRIAVIPHGNYDGFYPPAPSRRTARDALGIPTDAPVLLYFGLIRPYKQVPTLVETFGTIAPEDCHLLVAGNPWNDALEHEITALADRFENVHTTLEFIPDEDVPGYFAAADGVVLPFDGVLTSGSAILAMTFGRALIAPDEGCLPELIGAGGGITYDSNTSAGLAEALTDALANRDTLGRMGRRNRTVADELSWASIGRTTARLYRSLGI